VPSQVQSTATFVPVVKDAVLTRDGAGRIASAVEKGVTVTYTRDTAGRIATETRLGKVTTYTRDGSGRVLGRATV
jgi:YD repeat-containing protein